MSRAYSITVRGVVQGVGFRPFVYRLAREHDLRGWVLNAERGVEIHAEGNQPALQTFVENIKSHPPQAAVIAELLVEPVQFCGFTEFAIRESIGERQPTVRISPDLPACHQCLQELFDPQDRRHRYPYINCTNCGPRYSVLTSLPYDRPNTTMADWPMDDFCSAEYADPANRRFHAQPVACPTCGPHYFFQAGDQAARPGRLASDSASDPASDSARDSAGDDKLTRRENVVRGDEEAIRNAVEYLHAGKIVAVKGLGGYHLACDAKNADAVRALRTRKFRKEKPFAVMAKDIAVARALVELSPEAEALLTSVARPIVLAPAKTDLAGAQHVAPELAREVVPGVASEVAPGVASEVAPENDELGVMLPYTPLHALLFAAGAPAVLVMTSANRSSEPIAYEDSHALQQLAGIADAFLIGERPIARRVDDSVARAGVFGPAILRRARGYAPGAVSNFPTTRPILALGADLKNSITLVVDGQAFMSQHIGDLDQYESLCAFRETVRDLLAMYEINPNDLLVVHDAHPQYVSTIHAGELAASEKVAVQHHRAHIASVLAERGAWDQRVLGISFDGTGYGDDGSIWGGEIFAGSIRDGFQRAAHLRPAVLAGGDAAAASPVQAAAGFLTQLNDAPDFTGPPFAFPPRYADARKLVNTNVRCFATTSVGRLFDAAAALLGFTREITFEGQAAMWLERFAKQSPAGDAYPFPFSGEELDFRPLLQNVIHDRLRGREATEIARAFQRGVAQGLCDAIHSPTRAGDTLTGGIDTVVLSGGVFQNELLLRDVKELLETRQETAQLKVWTNHLVPANDGGISLGQAALAAFANPRVSAIEEKDAAWLEQVT